MKRRSFLKKAATSAVVPVTLSGLGLRTYNSTSLLNAISKRSAEGKVLVIIQLNGGNDGLNTIIPLDQYSNLSKARSNVIIEESKVLKLNGWDKTGLHPKMTGIQNLFNDGKVNVVHSIGYPQPDFSHFRATDIWMSASDSNKIVTTGWMGRYLNSKYPNFPSNYPNSTMPDPLAIQIGSLVSLTFMGPTTNMGMAITDPSTFYSLVDNISPSVPNTPAGEELAFIRLMAQQTNEYADVIKGAAGKGKNLSTKYPTSTGRNNLSEQLKIVAKLIHGGLKTPVYMVSIGGFDTHSNQVDSSSSSEGDHATLLKSLSDAIEAFQDDIKLLGISDRVVGMTFSEFGRRIQSNGSGGTDHGAGAPLIVFGDAVQPGFIGNNPSIPSTTTVNDNVPMQFDFRQVYATILKDWFEISSNEVDSIMGSAYDTLPIFKNSMSNIEDFADLVTQIGMDAIQPNPISHEGTLNFSTDSGGFISLNLFNAQGSMIKTFFSKDLSAGSHTYIANFEDIPNGNYILQLSSRIKSQSQFIQILK